MSQSVERLRFYHWEELDPAFAGYFLTGLEQYSSANRVPLDLIDFNAEVLAWTPPPGAGLLIGVVRDGVERRALLDLRDQVDRWVDLPLGSDGLYFKRCKSPQLSEVATREGLKTVHPLGPMYGTASDRVKLSSIRRTIAGRRRTYRINSMLDRLREIYWILRIATPAAFETPLAKPKTKRVLFQTRVWPSTRKDDYADVNAFRIELLRELRKNFGARFVGGLVNTDFARSIAPDLVSTQAMNPRGYAALVRDSEIAIYSAGLFGSTAFKLGEYLAAGCCIVGETVQNQLRRPLVDGSQLLQLESTDGILAACDRLFTQPRLAADMRQAALEYYRDECAPRAQIEHIVHTLVTS